MEEMDHAALARRIALLPPQQKRARTDLFASSDTCGMIQRERERQAQETAMQAEGADGGRGAEASADGQGGEAADRLAGVAHAVNVL